MDSSAGLALSPHQLSEASDCGFEIASDAVPIDRSVDDVATDADDRRELGVHFGEDFELVCTLPSDAVADAKAATPVELTEIGSVVDSEDGVTMDGDPLSDRGYTH
jgi:thiamine-monophosphate kinase